MPSWTVNMIFSKFLSSKVKFADSDVKMTNVSPKISSAMAIVSAMMAVMKILLYANDMACAHQIDSLAIMVIA